MLHVGWVACLRCEDQIVTVREQLAAGTRGEGGVSAPLQKVRRAWSAALWRVLVHVALYELNLLLVAICYVDA